MRRLLVIALLVGQINNMYGMKPDALAEIKINDILKNNAVLPYLNNLGNDLQHMPNLFFKSTQAQTLLFLLLQIIVIDKAETARACIDQILDKGATFNPLNLDTSNNNLLHLACHQNNLRALNAILAQPDCKDLINKPNATGYTPIFFALRSGKEFVDALIKHGASVIIKISNDKTPLHDAASDTNNADTVQLLINAGADVNAGNIFGGTPLHNAAWYEHDKVVEVLIANKANVNAQKNNMGNYDDDGATPLHLAAWRCNVRIIKLLIDAGASLTIPSKNWATPLVAAISTLRYQTMWPKTFPAIRYLISRGAPLKIEDIQSLLSYTQISEALLGMEIIKKSTKDPKGFELDEDGIQAIRTGQQATAIQSASTTKNPLAKMLNKLAKKLNTLKAKLVNLNDKLGLLKKKL